VREIKFRGKRIDNNKWVFGSLINLSPKGQYIVIYNIETDEETSYPVKSDSVGQYTGLKDIYEDDFTEDGLVFYSEEYLGFFVKLFDRNLDEEIKPLYDCLSEKVIGNKHENPELIK